MSEPRSSRSFTGFALTLLVLILVWRLWPHSPEAPPPPKKARPARTKTAARPAPPPPSTPVALPPQKTTPEAKLGLGAKVSTPTPHQERRRAQIPSELDLREQVIALRGGEWQLRLVISITSDDPQVMRRAVPLRGKLIEMLYFLVSHRVPESMRTLGGEERLHADLHQRYANVLRSEDFELNINALNLEERPAFDDE